MMSKAGMVLGAAFVLQTLPGAGQGFGFYGNSAPDEDDGPFAPSFYETQARELMPQSVNEPVAARAVTNFVEDEVRRRLSDTAPEQAVAVARAIVREANRRRMDPLFLMAIVQHESRFHARIVGSHGEIGLMQIKPSTAAWAAKRAGITFKGRDELFDPAFNVRIGAAYVSSLRARFKGRGTAFLSAYNMGPGALRGHLSNSRTLPKIYATKVLSEYANLRNDLAASVLLPGSIAFEGQRSAKIAFSQH